MKNYFKIKYLMLMLTILFGIAIAYLIFVIVNTGSSKVLFEVDSTSISFKGLLVGRMVFVVIFYLLALLFACVACFEETQQESNYIVGIAALLLAVSGYFLWLVIDTKHYRLDDKGLYACSFWESTDKMKQVCPLKDLDIESENSSENFTMVHKRGGVETHRTSHQGKINHIFVKSNIDNRIFFRVYDISSRSDDSKQRKEVIRERNRKLDEARKTLISLGFPTGDKADKKD